MYTVWLGNEEVVSIAVALRAAGASPDMHNDAGETMWDRAGLQVPPALYRALEEKLRGSDRTGG